MTPDPFAHHPELAALITPPAESFFRDFSIDKLEAVLRDKGLPTGWWYPDAHRNALRETALAGRRDADLWVFAYGSLMWDPAVAFREVRRATVQGYRRRFILKDVLGGRGTREAPGLMAALDTGGACEGLAFRIDRHAIDRETDILWRRECITPAYLPTFVPARIGEDTVDALTFVADHSAELIDADITRQDQIRYLTHGTGFLGSSADYLRNVARQFARLGIVDPEVDTLTRALPAPDPDPDPDPDPQA